MAAFDFPSSPSVNQTYTANGVTWKWNGTMWMRVSGAGYLEKIEEGNSKVEVDDSGSGNVTVTTDGTERLRITSDGKTGVGVASPLNRFHVYGANTIARFQSSTSYVDVMFQNTGATDGFIQYNNSGDFRFYANSGSTPTLDITAGAPGNVLCKGKLSVGDLTNPGALLSIPAGESNTPRLAIESAVDDNDFTITQYEDGNGTYTMLGQNVKLNSSGNNTILDSGHRTAGILFDARNHGAITFLTGGTNSVAEPVRIESNGRVAIGGFSGATHDLHIKTASSPAIKLEDTTQTTILQLYAQDSNANIGTHSQHDLRFNTDSTERLRIDSSGRLLLGLNSSIGGNAIFQVQGSGNKKAQFHQPDSGNCHIQFTNTQTGTSSNNGIEIGLGGDEQAQIWNYYNSFFRIATNNTERLRITSAGDMGLGTVTPTSFGPTFQISGTDPALLLQDTATAVDYYGMNIGNGHVTTWFDDSAYFAIGTAAGISGASYAEKLRITSGGDLGLGVSGGMNQAGTLYIQGGQGVRWTHTSDGTLYGDHYVSAGGEHVFRTGSSLTERLRITSDGDLKTANINISGYSHTHNIDNYSVFLSDNHANTFFGQNLRLDYISATNSGNHQLKVINQHNAIGGAGMLIGGNQSSNVNELNFYTVAANQPAGTRVDDTNKRLTIRSNGDITIRGTNSQYVEAAAFEITQASSNAITTNNGGYVSFNSLRNTNSSIISHSSSTNPTRITFPVAGAVHFSMYQDIRVTGTTGYTQCRLLKNGTNDRYALITYTDNQWDSIVMNTVVEVAANDYLELYYTGGTISGLDYQTWCSYNFVFYPINTNRG
tara:strand:+ start:448 stop:2928 length:2481 start_codon:yes stop_codon:yes gene_type:complete